VVRSVRQDYPPLGTSSHAVAWVSEHVALLDGDVPARDALECAYAYCPKIHPPSGWRRPPGRPRQTWLHQIDDGSTASIRQEWDLAVRCGHSQRTRLALQTSAAQAFWWWWSSTVIFEQINHDDDVCSLYWLHHDQSPPLSPYFPDLIPSYYCQLSHYWWLLHSFIFEVQNVLLVQILSSTVCSNLNWLWKDRLI